MKLNKKGAIEMSMTTIIVVILGITLLSLGLMFVRNIFKDIGGSSAKMSDLADKQMMEMFGESEDPISLPRDNVEIAQGDEDVLDIGIRNTGEDSGKFSIKPDGITVVSKPGAFKGDALKWLSWDTTDNTITSGKAKSLKILVAVPSNANLGTYQFKITLSCNAPGVCDEEPSANFFVKVVS